MTDGSPSTPARTRGRAPWIWIARLTVTAIVLAVVFSLVPVKEVWREAQMLPPGLWIGGLVVFLLGHAASAGKWRMLIGEGVSYPEAFRAHLAGLAANLCLPSVAGGDVVRAGMVMKSAKSVSRLAMGSVADRILDTFGLLILAAVGAAFAFNPGQGSQVIWLSLAGVGLAGVVGAFAAALVIDRRFQASAPSGKVARVLAAAAGATADLARHPRRLLLCLAISLAVQSTFIGINVAFAEAAKVEAPPAVWVFAWSSAKLISLAPISLGGLGVREASMAGLMRPFGADPAKVIAIGLIWQTLLYTSGLIGLAVQAVWKPGSAKRGASAPATEPTV